MAATPMPSVTTAGPLDHQGQVRWPQFQGRASTRNPQSHQLGERTGKHHSCNPKIPRTTATSTEMLVGAYQHHCPQVLRRHANQTRPQGLAKLHLRAMGGAGPSTRTKIWWVMGRGRGSMVGMKKANLANAAFKGKCPFSQVGSTVTFLSTCL